MSFEGDNMMGVKRNNRCIILQMLHKNGSMSRKRLAEGMHLTAAAITKIVGEMQTEGLLIEGDAVATGNAGRREVMVGINPNFGVALGILINARQAIISAVNLDGSLIFSNQIRIPQNAPADSTVRTLSNLLLQLIDENGISHESVIGIGLAVRGLISNDLRTSVNSYGALSDMNYPICDKFEECTGFKTVLNNNVRALHAAQIFLDYDDNYGSQYFLRCEYGIGSSLFVQNKIWSGNNQNCGEIGHVPVVRENGKLCNCGRRGCLETVASLTAIRESVTENLSPETTPIMWNICNERQTTELSVEDIFTAYENNDPGVTIVVNQAADELSKALYAVAKLIDPAKIVLYGKLFEQKAFLNRILNSDINIDKLVVEKSEYNCELEYKAASFLILEQFFINGGMPL